MKEKNLHIKQPIRGKEKDYPTVKFEECIKVANIVKELGGYATTENIGKALKIKGGGLARKIASTKRWGLLTGIGELRLTDLAKEIFYPIKEGQQEKAKIKAFMSVELFKSVYERFKDEEKLPSGDLLKNLLVTDYELKERDAITVSNIIKKSVSTFALFEKEINEIGNEMPKGSTASKTIIPTEIRAEKETIYELSKKLGELEFISKYQDKIKLPKEKILSIIEEMSKTSQNLKSFNSIVSVTKEELSSNDIDISVALKRTKYFSNTLEHDIGITKEKENETGKKNQKEK